MNLLNQLKTYGKRVPWLYETVRKYRAQAQEAEYMAVRDYYYPKTCGFLAEPGYLVRSHDLLRRHWSGPKEVKSSLKNVRLFIVGPTVVGAIQFMSELARSFDAVVVDFGGYCRSMERGDAAVRAEFQKVLLEAFQKGHRAHPFDLSWMSATNVFVAPETLNEIRRAGVPVAVYNMDDKHQYLENPRLGFPNGQKPLIGSVDVFLSNSIESVRWYIAEGAAAYYMLPGVDPYIFKPLPVSKELDVSFIGAAYGIRSRFIERLKQSGIRVSCFGRGWGHVVSDEEKENIFSRSWINLGIGGVGYSNRITCVKGRDAEVPGSGNVLMTSYDAELTRMWTIGKEILCYYNDIDCVDQIRYYLDNKDVLLAIGQAARRRALREHTWTHRLTELLAWMGILEPISGQPAQLGHADFF